MIVAFCGHAQFSGSKECEERLLAFLEERVGDLHAELYLGNHGGFDRFAYTCCKKYRQSHPRVSLVLVTPYLAEDGHRSLREQSGGYDFVLYPEIEDKPKRYAILYRNRYMVEKADCVVAYVSHTWGGAYTTYRYAQRKGKEIVNLADLDGEIP